MKINHFTKKLQRFCLRSRRTSSKALVFIFPPFPCRERAILSQSLRGTIRRRRPLRRRCLRSLLWARLLQKVNILKLRTVVLLR